jgi:AGCS family alanine or glycine:cation symporter
MQALEKLFATLVDYAWGPPLIVVLLGGGFVLLAGSRLLPFTGLVHAIDILRGKFDHEGDPGDITHFQALTTALSSTIGMGNIAGVAVAITQGGPGAVFWMWIAAIVGMATKFFTCTLAVMYRGTDSTGAVQGGPMYYIEVGLGKKWRFLAVLFSVCGMVGCLAMFQTNQMAEVMKVSLGIEPWITGAVATTLVAIVIFGGIERIAQVASKLVPSMCGLYLVCVVCILIMNFERVPDVFMRIFHDAFNGTAATGGVAGITVATVIQTGVKRAAFSNEAGIGTAPMAHGAARTTEPVREGLVAMLGPFIDTIIVCSLTAFAILSSDFWRSDVGGSNIKAVSLTLNAFEASLGQPGRYALIACVALFALSTMFGYAYYGRKCFSFLFGVERGRIYDVIYLSMLFAGAVWSADLVVDFLDTAFALMVWPNMLATFLLAPRVMKATREYFARYRGGEAS